MRPSTWGGGIELSILANRFNVEIGAWNVDTCRCHVFGEEQGAAAAGQLGSPCAACVTGLLQTGALGVFRGPCRVMPRLPLPLRQVCTAVLLTSVVLVSPSVMLMCGAASVQTRQPVPCWLGHVRLRGFLPSPRADSLPDPSQLLCLFANARLELFVVLGQ